VARRSDEGKKLTAVAKTCYDFPASVANYRKVIAHVAVKNDGATPRQKFFHPTWSNMTCRFTRKHTKREKAGEKSALKT
jgi:hypothetical protein